MHSDGSGPSVGPKAASFRLEGTRPASFLVTPRAAEAAPTPCSRSGPSFAPGSRRPVTSRARVPRFPRGVQGEGRPQTGPGFMKPTFAGVR